jgi:GMP synthase (glutamine-hydrolysing)
MVLNQTETVVILDFGSQYTQLIARRVREHRVFSVILPYKASLPEIQSYAPRALILSGGPANVYDKRAPLPDQRIFSLGIPVLGICYGLQVIGHLLSGRVKKTHLREFGHADLVVDRSEDLFRGMPRETPCWMSHGDEVTEIPPGFEAIAHTTSSRIASLRHAEKKIYGVQFHPEVIHTPLGKQIFRNFLFEIAHLSGDWTPASFIERTVRDIRERVGGERVVLGLSGGVDSSVAAVLIHKAIGSRLTSIFVDNGLLRLGEREGVSEMFRKHLGLNLRVVDARRPFLKALAGVRDPERKRKIIGHVFIEVFQREARKIGRVSYLAQGTLYPDVIESVSAHGSPTSVIKTHHNVGGLPRKMHLKLVEPFRMLFKDEVREVGAELGLAQDLLGRHPFPGPGLAVRILGAVTSERLTLLRQADWIVINEVKKAGLYPGLWQAFAVLLPVKSVGVMGDERTYEHVVAVRAVHSEDGMTADWAKIPPEVLSRISNRIINEVRGINRVCYDVSSKPPSTIEWE